MYILLANIFLYGTIIILPLQFQQEDVNDSADKSMIDYPPRFIFNISPDAKAQPCTLKLQLTEMSQDIKFQIKLGEKYSFL